MWPIEGKEDAAIKENFRIFCQDALLLGKSTISELGIETVERTRSSPRGRPFLEIIVTFADNFARDRVFSCGPQLSEYRDEDGKPTCGIRLQIPGHLMGQFRTLESYAFAQRNQHGKGLVF